MKKIFSKIIPILLTALILVSVFWYCFIYDRNFTRDVLLTQARYHSTDGNPRFASWFYDTAYELSDQNDGVAIELANQFKAAGNFTKAEYTLTNAIADAPTAKLYMALCKTYVQKDKLLDAVALLDNIPEADIKAELDAIRPAAPVTDPTPGFYSEYIALNLISDSGKIYFSMDAEYPSVDNGPFSETVVLPEGETVVRAVTVDSNGLVGPLTTVTFTIGGVIEEVIFTDQSIEMALRQTINADAEDKIYTNQLWDVKEFSVPAEAVDLQDVAHLPYLEKLTIDNHTLDSTLFLTALSNLKELNLTGCRFSPQDLEIIAGLPALEKLTISDCNLSTVAGLENAQKLIYLDLSNNAIRNLEPLSSLLNLRTLKMGHNALTSLEVLRNLTGLAELDVSYNALTTLAPLSDCHGLTSLVANNNQISTLEGINQLTGLTVLNVNKNALTDVNILSGNISLVELYFSNNSVSNISDLHTLTNLELLTFANNQVESLPAWPDGCKLRSIDGSNNQIESIAVLKNMHSMTHVTMDYNKIASVNELEGCYSLVQVNVYGNPIENVDALKAREIIVNWDPTLAEAE